MIDTSRKSETLRQAVAEARVRAAPSSIQAVEDNTVPKGDVLAAARIAGIAAAKKTGDLIPFCHPLSVDCVSIEFELGKEEIVIRSRVKAVAKTGVEMEALTAASLAALTVYDMLKPLDNTLSVERIVLLEKKGGKSDFKDRLEKPVRAGVLVISDSTFRGEREDKSGKIIQEKLKAHAVDVEIYRILPDDRTVITQELRKLSDEQSLDLVLTTGGTGLGPKDVTPEATNAVIQKTAPGIVEVMRSYGQKRTPFAMLSRNAAGVRGKTLIINLPGSSRGARESMEALFPGILHGLRMLWGAGHEEKVKETKKTGHD